MIEITIYAWSDAPFWMKKLSTNGGDEDWVAVSEKQLDELDQSMYLPRSNILDSYYVEDEDLWVYIGAHS